MANPYMPSPHASPEAYQREIRRVPHETAPTQCITASIGIATLNGSDLSQVRLAPAESAMQLLAAVDRRLYMAKRGGRNQVSVATL